MGGRPCYCQPVGCQSFGMILDRGVKEACRIYLIMSCALVVFEYHILLDNNIMNLNNISRMTKHEW
ncbi:hypothetical protein BT69DRAFT_554837 [Atractiella rhizophila]|nr:hypothetical protein BT69DRAFT_554837 [Atractiella rhizophila]